MAGSAESFEASPDHRLLQDRSLVIFQMSGVSAQGFGQHVKAAWGLITRLGCLLVPNNCVMCDFSSNSDRFEELAVVALDVLFIALLVLHHILQVDSQHAAGQAEVTDLNSAVVVDEDVARFEITVNNFRVMQVL